MSSMKEFIKQCVADGTIDKSIVKELVNHIKRDRNKMPESTKRKISESKKGQSSQNKGRVWMYNNKVKQSKLVESSKVDEYTKDEWIKGRLEFNKA